MDRYDSRRAMKLKFAEMRALSEMINNDQEFVKRIKKAFNIKASSKSEEPTRKSGSSKQLDRMRSRKRTSPGTKGMGLPEQLTESLTPFVQQILQDYYG